jgi:LysR family transcriptional regulator, low CO2-responsive transcriptional regulator
MVFETVARLGSVTKAAESLHLAQPTVSVQLRKLAETLELQLFVQRGRHLYLTAGGQELLSACEELVELLQRTETRLAALRGGEGEILRVAAVSGGRQLAARMLASFCARHPGIRASLHVANCSQLMERLIAQEDDLYILTLPCDAPGVSGHLLATESLRFYCGPTDPLGSAGCVSLSEVMRRTFVAREPGSGTRRLLQAMLEPPECELCIRAELGSDEAVAEAVAAGIGIALLPVATAAPFLAAGLLAAVRADISDLELKWHLVHRNGTALPAAALLFVKEALAEASPGPECYAGDYVPRAPRTSVSKLVLLLTTASAADILSLTEG